MAGERLKAWWSKVRLGWVAGILIGRLNNIFSLCLLHSALRTFGHCIPARTSPLTIVWCCCTLLTPRKLAFHRARPAQPSGQEDARDGIVLLIMRSGPSFMIHATDVIPHCGVGGDKGEGGGRELSAFHRFSAVFRINTHFCLRYFSFGN